MKNTTRIGLLDLLCPHSCRGCGQLGDVLCECCKKNLLEERQAICPLCKRVLAGKGKDDENISQAKCDECDLPLEAVFVGGWREGVLDKLIKDYKYRSVRAVGEVLAEVLDTAMGTMALDVKDEVVVVPLPTIGRHIRERGIDHTRDLARRLAKRRGWKCEQILGRRTDAVQVGASIKKRQEQASRAYEVVKAVDVDTIYLLVDDVWTTGATVLSAAEVLRAAGAKRIMTAVVATGKARETEADVDTKMPS